MYSGVLYWLLGIVMGIINLSFMRILIEFSFYGISGASVQAAVDNGCGGFLILLGSFNGFDNCHNDEEE